MKIVFFLYSLMSKDITWSWSSFWVCLYNYEINIYANSFNLLTFIWFSVDYPMYCSCSIYDLSYQIFFLRYGLSEMFLENDISGEHWFPPFPTHIFSTYEHCKLECRGQKVILTLLWTYEIQFAENIKKVSVHRNEMIWLFFERNAMISMYE